MTTKFARRAYDAAISLDSALSRIFAALSAAVYRLETKAALGLARSLRKEAFDASEAAAAAADHAAQAKATAARLKADSLTTFRTNSVAAARLERDYA